MLKRILLLTNFLVGAFLYAQTEEVFIEGEVFDEYLIPFYGAKIKTEEGKQAVTDDNGVFKIKTTLPIKLHIYADGYEPEMMIVTKAKTKFSLILKESSKLDEVVLSASRIPEKIFESPVTVSRMGQTDIKSIPAVNFYDGLANVKGVSTFNIGVLQKIVNTRGFTDTQDFRFVQLIDGVDNAIPQTDMSFGNTFGVNHLDVESVEILPGASSALYGSSAFNGVMLINTKSPFEYTGISAELKSGVTKQKSGVDPFYNPSIRLAYMFDNNFAAKVNFSYYKGEDWHASDVRDISTGTIRDTSGRNSTSYNGINTYGDETAVNLKFLALQKFMFVRNGEDKGLIQKYRDLIQKTPNVFVSRTGYKEEFLTTNDADAKKFDASLYYRPLGNDKLEIVWTSKFKLGDYVRQVSPGRYRQDDTHYRQHILEFKGRNFFLRGYHTKIDFGNYYGVIPASVMLNLNAKLNGQWFADYAKVFMTNFDSNSSNRQQALMMADKLARAKADDTRFVPGTSRFEKEFNRISTTSANEGGAKYFGLSTLGQIDFQYDFSKHINFIDFLVGGSYRDNVVNTKGTIYTDKPDDLINIYQYGVYGQVKKKLFDDRLKLMGSLRYDGSKNFKSTFSPRLAANVIVGKNKNHNFRLSYQTAFRNPTVENQFLGAVVGENAYVVGSLPENWKRLNLPTTNGMTVNEELIKRPGLLGQTYFKYYYDVLSSLKDNATPEQMLAKSQEKIKNLKTISFADKTLKSEEVTALEFGYRGLFSIENRVFEIETNAFYNSYENFIAKSIVLIPKYGDVTLEPELELVKAFDDKGTPVDKDTYSAALYAMIKGDYATFVSPFNSNAEIQSFGASVSIKTKLLNDFDLSVTYNYSDYNFDRETAPYFFSAFNTPKHSVKASFGHRKLFKNFGFNIAYRWQTEHQWESAYGNGLIEERSVFDAQVSYAIPSLKSRIRIGGDNIGGKQYYTSIGTPAVGSIYYLSWIIND